MFASERIRKIKNLLTEYHEVDISTLCDVLSSSVSTVRRDLDKLEAEGFLKRTHGGAVLSDNPPISLLQDTVRDLPEEVNSIASLASNLVSPGEQIFLGSGAICTAIAAYLKAGWSGSVITNNFNAAFDLVKCRDISTVLLGGTVRENNGKILTDTSFAAVELEQFFISKAFVSVTGMTISHGYFADSPEQIALFQTLKEHSLEMYVVATEDKFNKIGNYRIGDIHTFKNIITTGNISDEFKQFCIEHGFSLLTSYKI